MKKLTYLLCMSLLLCNVVFAEDEEAEEVEKPKAIYLKMDPNYLVNLKSTGRPHFMQITAELMGFGEDVIDAATTHMPAIRHSLLMLFSEQDLKTMKTKEGKQALIEQSKKKINEVLAKETEGLEIKGVFFTSFVIQ